jgi:hypothetical protein
LLYHRSTSVLDTKVETNDGAVCWIRIINVNAAGAALFVDVVGLLIGVWKIVLKFDFMKKFSPETKQELPEIDTGEAN